MFMKICTKCNTKYAYNESCPNKCQDKAKQERNKVYDKAQRKNADFYHSNEWTRLTKECKNRFNGLDIYQLYKYNHIVAGILSHHIEEVNDNPDRQYDLSNLIYLSDDSHREVHKIYNQSEALKIDLQRFLFEIVKRYEKEH